MKVSLYAYFVITFFAYSCLTLPCYADEKLRLLVWEGYAPAKQVKQFENYIRDKYAVSLTMEVKYISDPEEFFTSLRFKSVDLITPTHNLIKDERYKFITNEMLAPLDLELIPNYKNIIPALQNAEYITENNQVYGVPFIHGPYGLAYNTKVLSAPLSWDVLWQPVFKGKYAVARDYPEVNIYITALALGYKGAQVYDYDALNNPEFKTKLSYLAQNAKSLWSGVDKADDIQGLPLAVVWGFSLPELNKRGEVWRIATPKEGTMGWVDNYAISRELKDKPLLLKFAMEWLNFVIGAEFQVDVVVREIGSSPVNTRIKDKLTADEIEQTHIDNVDFFQDNRILWPTIDNMRDRNGIKKLWEDAKANRVQLN